MLGDRANVLLLISGGIAAYKSCFLARLLVQAGFSVRCAMTDAAQHFVGPVTFRSLTGHGVATDLWGEGDTDPLDHVELARWADIAVVAPATANTLAKMAHGLADDIVSTLLLAYPGELLVAPAMNDGMWQHPATVSNLTTLRSRGVHVVDPGKGWLACGVEAEGRMAEPEEIMARIEALAGALPNNQDSAQSGLLSGRRVLVTAGPTREPLDAIRYLTNRSTGSFGFALVRAAVKLGAEVVLVHGPTSSAPPRGPSRTIPVETAAEMAAAVQDHLTGTDLLLMAAAVADFTPAHLAEGKLKKETLGTSWKIEMTRTADILAGIADSDEHPNLKVAGFALETEDLLDRAEAKRSAKGMDWVVANNPTAADGAFGPGQHHVWLLGESGVIWDSGAMDKTDMAQELMTRLAGLLTEDSAS